MLTFAYIISIICALFIAYWDAKERIIPDIWLWPLMISGIYLFGGNPEHVMAALFGYITGFILMMALRKKEALGFGDVKLMAVSGMFLGINGLSLAVIMACILGIIWGLARKQKFVPFAPFMILGAMAYYLISYYK
jgi:prepilin signal peptidase PulO-like enzyme (type II secretory pathway)